MFGKKGNVHIGSADPHAAPIIDPRYNEFTFGLFSYLSTRGGSDVLS
jgi:hypothetical protein